MVISALAGRLYLAGARQRPEGLDRLDARLDRIEGVVLRGRAEWIARLEAAR